MKKERKLKKSMYWFVLAIMLIIVYKTIDNFAEIKAGIGNLFHVLMPFILGIILAYVLYSPVKKLENLLKKPKKLKFISKNATFLSVLIVYIVVIIALVFVFKYIIPLICSSVIDFVSNFPNYYASINETISNLPEDSFFKNETVVENVKKIGEINISDYINIEKITKYAQGALSVFTGIFNLFVSIIVSSYILLERKEIIKFAKRFIQAIFKEETCEKIGKYFNRTNEIFLKFLASQLLDAIVVGILTSIAMSLLGVKYAVLLGVMIGLFNMIPYFGAIIAVIIATAITAITGGLSQAIWMVIIVTVLQQIDANIINPKIVGDSLKISPLLVIFAVTIGGEYFNVLGMFLAVPVAAVIKVIISDFIDIKLENKKSQSQS